MNILVLKPWSRLTTPAVARVTAIRCSGEKVYLGLSNGDLLVMAINSQSEAPLSEPNSIRSFRSFSDAKHMFADNKTAQSFLLERSFPQAASLAIVTIDTIPLYDHASGRVVLLIATDDALHVKELVGVHLTLVKILDEVRGCSALHFVTVLERKLLVVGLRKRVLIYEIEQRTRNIYEFSLVANHQFREKIKDLCFCANQKQTLVATSHSFHIVDLFGSFAVQELPKTFADLGNFVQPSLFSYFGLSNTGPSIKIIRCGPHRSLVINDLQTALIRQGSGLSRLEESRVTLSAAPVAIDYLYPCYVLVTYVKTLEVIDIDSGCRIQEFKHLLNTSQISVALAAKNAFIGAGSLVFHFSILSTQDQLDQFLSMGDSFKFREDFADVRTFGIDRALTYIAALDDNDTFFFDKNNPAASALKTRQLYLRDLQKEKAVLFFEKYSKYSEALVDIASEWVISLTDILPLFPQFLNGSSHKPSGGLMVDSRRRDSIRNVSIDDLELVNSNEASPDKFSKTDPNKEALTLNTVARFIEALNSFIIYLTDQRRIHYSLFSSGAEIPSIKWKAVELNVLDLYPGIDLSNVPSMISNCMSTIDTTLFLCYYYSKPMLLGPLLRLPNNNCNAKVVNECMLKKIHMHNDALEGFLSQLLDFYYGRELHDDALAMLKDLAHDQDHVDTNGFQKLLSTPALSVRYLQKLSSDYLELIFQYVTWILKESNDRMVHAEAVFMNESYECESYDNFKVYEFLKNVSGSDVLAIRYLEWLLNETDILELPGRQESVIKFATKLSLFYLRKLELLKSASADFVASSWYIKLYELLESNRQYEPWTILRNIPTSEDKYLRFTIFIYRRLGEHQKSVDILYNQLEDLEGAMAYCGEVYEQPNGRQTGTELLHKLLEDLLMHYDENQNAVVTLLLTQGHRMSTLDVLAALPSTFPLYKLNPFLERTTCLKQNELYKAHMTGQLYERGSAKLQYQLLMAQQGFTTIEKNEPCLVCGKSLNCGMLCAGHNHRAVHYGCVMQR